MSRVSLLTVAHIVVTVVLLSFSATITSAELLDPATDAPVSEETGSNCNGAVDLQTGECITSNRTSGSGSGGTSGSGSGEIGELVNPLKVKTIDDFLFKLIDVILVFATPIIILFIMYAGYLFVTAAGNAEQISSARTALLWSVVGGVIVLGAKLISDVIKGTINAF